MQNGGQGNESPLAGFNCRDPLGYGGKAPVAETNMLKEC